MLTSALAGVCVAGVVSIAPVGAASRVASQPAATPSATATATPTPNATPSASATAGPTGAPADVFLAFAEPAPTDPSDPCRTGVTFRRNDIGDHDEIVVCTFDSNGDPAPTDTSNAVLQWRITGVQNEPTVRFNPSPPPAETTGAGATAIAGIDAVNFAGDNEISVSLLDATGALVDSFSVEKEVLEGCICPRNIPTELTAHKERRVIKGRAKSQVPECEPRRDVTLFRRRQGKDDVIGFDKTNASGEWSIESGRRGGTYYARVTAASFEDPETGTTRNCLADQSDDVRRP